MRVVPTPFLRALRELADRHGLLLAFDEVQTGVGRTGSFFAYQRCGVTPDVMGIAKAIGGGFPLGACLTTAEAGKGMTAGTHGSTFGANPLAMAVGNAVLDIVLAPGFSTGYGEAPILFRQRLAEIKDRHPNVVADVRGEGLLLGLALPSVRTASLSTRCAARSCSRSPLAIMSCGCCRRSLSRSRKSPKPSNASTVPPIALNARSRKRRSPPR